MTSGLYQCAQDAGDYADAEQREARQLQWLSCTEIPPRPWRIESGGGLVPESLSHGLILGGLKTMRDRADLALDDREAFVGRRQPDRGAVARPGEINRLITRERHNAGTDASSRLPEVQGCDRVADYLQKAPTTMSAGVTHRSLSAPPRVTRGAAAMRRKGALKWQRHHNGRGRLSPSRRDRGRPRGRRPCATRDLGQRPMTTELRYGRRGRGRGQRTTV